MRIKDEQRQKTGVGHPTWELCRAQTPRVVGGGGLAAPSRLCQKAVTVAEPVTAPGWAGFSLWVCTAKLRPAGPGGPVSSTSTTCMSVRLQPAEEGGQFIQSVHNYDTQSLCSPKVSHKHPDDTIEA